MTTILKKMLIATLVAGLPTLASAADPTLLAGAKPGALTAETLQKNPAAGPMESRPADTAAARTTRLGYVDLNRIGSETAQGKAAEAKLKEMQDKLQTRVDAKRQQVNKLRRSVEAKLPTLSPEQREAKAKEFQKKVEEFQKYGKKLEEDLFTTQEKETKGLYDATEQAAVAYGKANGFSAIVIKKELLYVGDNIDAQDVTDALIKTMDAAARKK